SGSLYFDAPALLARYHVNVTLRHAAVLPGPLRAKRAAGAGCRAVLLRLRFVDAVGGRFACDAHSERLGLRVGARVIGIGSPYVGRAFPLRTALFVTCERVSRLIRLQPRGELLVRERLNLSGRRRG